MNRKLISKSFMAKPSIGVLTLGLILTAWAPAFAQLLPQPKATSPIEIAALPDAPGEAFRAPVRNSVAAANDSSSSADSHFGSPPATQSARQTRMASRLDKVVSPEQPAPTLSGRDKVLMGVKDSVTPFSIVSWFTAAGYSHLTNSSPNFGVNSGAFGERLGAAAIRGISGNILSNSIMANVFHEDPRYYQMGRSHSIGKRIVYAGTRVFLTRADSGKTTANLSLLFGTLASSILTNAYYPQRNHGVGQTMEIFAGSVGGSALGFGVTEFLGDALRLDHLKKSE